MKFLWIARLYFYSMINGFSGQLSQSKFKIVQVYNLWENAAPLQELSSCKVIGFSFLR